MCRIRRRKPARHPSEDRLPGGCAAGNFCRFVAFAGVPHRGDFTADFCAAGIAGEFGGAGISVIRRATKRRHF
jgi:hypothetical protein